MALNKAILALTLAAMVLVASTVPAAVAEDNCFCDCMRNQCIKVPKTTKEECAPACDNGCTEAGYKGQPHPGEFCGL